VFEPLETTPSILEEGKTREAIVRPDRKLEEAMVEEERGAKPQELELEPVADEFMCSMCGAPVKATAKRCPKCGTEFM
jgi:rubrerythrin